MSQRNFPPPPQRFLTSQRFLPDVPVPPPPEPPELPQITLPWDVILQILVISSFNDVVKACQADKQFAAYCQEDELWRQKLIRDYPADVQFRKYGTSWRSFYFNRARPEKSRSSTRRVSATSPKSGQSGFGPARPSPKSTRTSPSWPSPTRSLTRKLSSFTPIEP